jgi:hypothetical protein
VARIFVSSTFVDLKEYRQKVSQAIRRAGHEDVAMEYYVAEDKRPVDRLQMCPAAISISESSLGARCLGSRIESGFRLRKWSIVKLSLQTSRV